LTNVLAEPDGHLLRRELVLLVGPLWVTLKDEAFDRLFQVLHLLDRSVPDILIVEGTLHNLGEQATPKTSFMGRRAAPRQASGLSSRNQETLVRARH